MTGCTFLRLGGIMELKAKQSTKSFKCHRSDDGLTGTVEAVGVLFDEVDLDKEHFTNETYLGKAAGNGQDATLNHRLPIKTKDTKANGVLKSFSKNIFTNPVESIKSDIGLIGRHVLDLSNDFEAWVFDQAENGAMKWSTGTAHHMMDVTEDGTIKSWPIIEWAYTPTPMQPKNGIIQSIKSFVIDDSPEGDKESSDGVPEGQNIVIHNHIHTDTEVKTMSDETEVKEETAVTDGVKASDWKAIEAKLDQLLEIEQNKPKVKAAPDVAIVEDEADKALKGNPFKHAGEFYKSVYDHEQGRHDIRLSPLKSDMHEVGQVFEMPMAIKTITGAGELVPSDGGFLVGQQVQQGIVVRENNQPDVWNRAFNVPIGPNANRLVINALKEDSRVAGSRWGGIQAYWGGEADTITASKPSFRQIEEKLKKLFALVYATSELLDDTVAFANLVNQLVPQELMFQKNEAAFNGSGVGKPLGILNSGFAGGVSVAKENGQAAATVVAENIINMWARRWGNGSYVWFINRDVSPQLPQMNLAVGTGGMLVYMPPGGLSGSPYGALLGAPVIEVEHCQTLGTVGDIVLANMSEYLTISKGGTQTASSIHVRFLNDESVFRFIERVDGMPTWALPLTPLNGTATQSPFVKLATRA